jgi:NAD(P)-dependent dehydrogenase (short-subunit alcohol dehydrogenase family)
MVPLLLQHGHHVTIAVRDIRRGQHLAQQWQQQTSGTVHVEHLDLADLRSVTRLIEALLGRNVSVLINNAGLSSRAAAPTAQGYEAHWGVMHLGHAALTLGLLDDLARVQGRVLTIAAYGHRYARLDVATTTGDKPINPYAAYVQAKLAQVTFIRHLADHSPAATRASGVTALAAHPGMVATALAPDLPRAVRAAAMRLAVTAQRSAQAMVELAVAHPGAPSGSYFSYHTFTRRMPTHPAKLSPRVQRLEHSQRVWRLTLEQLAKAGHPAKWYSHEG